MSDHLISIIHYLDEPADLIACAHINRAWRIAALSPSPCRRILAQRWPTWWYCNIKEYFPDWDFATVESPKSKYPLPIYYQYLLDNYRAEIQLQDALENVIEGYQAPSWYWRRAESFGLVAIDITQRFKREAYFNGDLARLYENLIATTFLQSRAVLWFWFHVQPAKQIIAMPTHQHLYQHTIWKMLIFFDLWLDPAADLGFIMRTVEQIERGFRTIHSELCIELGQYTKDIPLVKLFDPTSGVQIPAKLEYRIISALHHYLFHNFDFKGVNDNDMYHLELHLPTRALYHRRASPMFIGLLLQELAARLGVRLDLMSFPWRMCARCRTGLVDTPYVYFSLTNAKQYTSPRDYIRDLPPSIRRTIQPSQLSKLYQEIEQMGPSHLEQLLERTLNNLMTSIPRESESIVEIWQFLRLLQLEIAWKLLISPDFSVEKMKERRGTLSYMDAFERLTIDVGFMMHAIPFVSGDHIPSMDTWYLSPCLEDDYRGMIAIDNANEPFVILGYMTDCDTYRVLYAFNKCIMDVDTPRLIEPSDLTSSIFQSPIAQYMHDLVMGHDAQTVPPKDSPLGPCFTIWLGRYFSHWDPTTMQYIPRCPNIETIKPPDYPGDGDLY